MVEPDRKDLYVLVADADMLQTILKILARPGSLGIHPIEYDVERHLQRDPGCRRQPLRYLRSVLSNYKYALVVFDRDGCGDSASREEIQRTVELEMARNGWDGRSKAIVIEPELETWVWNGSDEVSGILGWDSNYGGLKAWLAGKGLFPDGATKPPDPKKAMKEALREKKQRASPALFHLLAGSSPLQGCNCPAFSELRDTLQAWFPANAD